MRVRLIKPVFIGGMVRKSGEVIEVTEKQFSAKAMERVGDAPAAPAPETEASVPVADAPSDVNDAGREMPVASRRGRPRKAD